MMGVSHRLELAFLGGGHGGLGPVAPEGAVLNFVRMIPEGDTRGSPILRSRSAKHMERILLRCFVTDELAGAF
jgi:hypothetical protein